MMRSKFIAIGMAVLIVMTAALLAILPAPILAGPPSDVVAPTDPVLINGDFETGDLTGWMTFTTDNGTLGPGFPKIVLFAPSKNVTATLSAQFQVGQVLSEKGVYRGGGIFQDVSLPIGDYDIVVDIVAAKSVPGLGNASGGLFELLVDGSVVKSHDFGFIPGDTIKHSKLAALVSIINPGTHEIRLRITRPFLQLTDTPSQFVDDIRISPVVVSTAGIQGGGDLGPVDVKVRVKEDLSPFVTESNGIKRAIEEISRSLDDKLWKDETHLDTKQGHRVFDREGSAVRELQAELREGKVSQAALDAAQTAVDDLAAVDRALADVVIQEIQDAETLDPKREKKVEQELQKALEELAKGDEELARGNADKAIAHYKKAWEHATQAQAMKG